MAILYKSSKFSTYSYYVLYPIIILVSAYMVYKLSFYDNFSIFNSIMFIVFAYTLFVSIDSLCRLKYIEVTEENIIIKKKAADEIVEYSNVEAVYNIRNRNGNSLILWYKDSNTNNSKCILVLPDGKSTKSEIDSPIYSSLDIDLEITKYIKDRAIKSNPAYNYSIKPRWFLFGIK